MRGPQQVIGASPVLQAEHVLAVLAPAAGSLVRIAWQQRREVDLLETGRFISSRTIRSTLRSTIQPNGNQQ
jgi:hypothetical protein